jgi:protein-tyrosine kinase
VAEADRISVACSPALQLESLPAIKFDEGRLAEHRIVGLNRGDSRTRPFNLLRTKLAQLLQGPSPRLIGVTSATPAAGKSFISVNLALSLAKVSEGPVILVDLDLRRGSVAAELGLEPVRDVRTFLLGEAALQDIGLRIEGLPLVILPTNAAAEESAELLAGERFIHLEQALRAQPANTVVLFDLPPVFANDDALLSVERLDGYILVVDSTETSKAHVVDAMSMLAPTPCIGTILNRYKGPMFDKFGYGSDVYGKYYG